MGSIRSIFSFFCFCGLLAFWAITAQAGLESPFSSEVRGLDIPNSHYLSYRNEGPGTLIRGMAPRDISDVAQLSRLGVSQVLIFKNFSSHGPSLKEQLQILRTGGYVGEDKVKHVPFPWKDIKDYRVACGQVVEALQILENAMRSGEKLYYHCTVGEDRTGMLSGLYRIRHHSWSPRRAFYDEMCEKGFGHGNYGKPYKNVVLKIRESLTPLYWKLAFLFYKKKQALTLDICNEDPELVSKTYQSKWQPELRYLKCPSSSKYPYDEDQ